MKLNSNKQPKQIAAPVIDRPMLHRADSLINGQRQQDYGDKLSNFTQIAMLFTGTLATKLLPNQTISAEDVALLMMQVKIARLAKSPDHRDSIIDVAGYAGCYDKILDEKETPVSESTINNLLQQVCSQV